MLCKQIFQRSLRRLHQCESVSAFLCTGRRRPLTSIWTMSPTILQRPRRGSSSVSKTGHGFSAATARVRGKKGTGSKRFSRWMDTQTALLKKPWSWNVKSKLKRRPAVRRRRNHVRGRPGVRRGKVRPGVRQGRWRPGVRRGRPEVRRGRERRMRGRPEVKYTRRFPTCQELVKKISKILTRKGIKVAHTSKRLRNRLVHVKDPIEAERRKGAVYQIKCPCGSSYVGESGRPKNVRLKEHIADIKFARTDKSATARHFETCCEDMDPLAAKTLALEGPWKRRKIREVIEIRQLRPSINQDVGTVTLSPIWDSILKNTA